MSEVVLAGRTSAEEISRVAAGDLLRLDPDALSRVAANRDSLEAELQRGAPLYGITTGFGALVSEHVPASSQGRLQVNLLRSHACGVGPDLPRKVVRAAIAIRLNSLLLAHSGVRPELLERVALLLNAGYTPRVPRTGSLGASGDLAPSAHAFLPLIGEGEVHDRSGHLVSGADALQRLGLEPFELGAKEGLALINGTHFMCAIGALLCVRLATLFDTIDVVAAATIDALRGTPSAFDPRVHALRGIDGQTRSAANIAAALAGSTRAASSPGTGRLQDAYSLRCAAQVHGAAREGLDFVAGVVRKELNAVTDNPIVFDQQPTVVSAGNFHGQILALAFDMLRLTLADLGSISERRIFRLVSPSLNGSLPPFLTRSAGLSSGYMVVQYVAAALVSELRALSHPVSVDSISTSDNQEDHVSMGMTGALMALESTQRLEQIIAYELLCAIQALDCDPGLPGAIVARAQAAVRERVAMLEEDRPPSEDLRAIQPLIGTLGGLLGRET